MSVGYVAIWCLYLSVLFVFVAEIRSGGCTGCFILKDRSFIMPILCLTSCRELETAPSKIEMLRIDSTAVRRASAETPPVETLSLIIVVHISSGDRGAAVTRR